LLLGVWVIVAGFYVLASLGSHGAMPTNVYFFLAAMVGISLAMHLIVRWLAPKASQILLPVSALLNGIGFIEISRWNPPLASQQALWYAVSAIAVAVTVAVRVGVGVGVSVGVSVSNTPLCGIFDDESPEHVVSGI